MTIAERIPLSTLTTFRAGGPARYVATCASPDDLTTALAYARERRIPFYVLGSGSNVLAADAGYEGLIILPRIDGVSFDESENGVLVSVGAGVIWDDLVMEVASRELWGIENLAGIPGTTGAAPVQNIGAYGAEVADTLAFVEALDLRTGQTVRLSKEECALGYRDSRFKRAHEFIITRVGFLLSRTSMPNTSYADLARAAQGGEDLSSPRAIGKAVRRIRSGKFPDLRQSGTAGSFFKNPVVSAAVYAELLTRYPLLPGFPSDSGVKIPLAFVLDRLLTLRGFRIGSARLFEAQPLVVVLDENGSATDVERLAGEVVTRVMDATGINVEREVRTLS